MPNDNARERADDYEVELSAELWNWQPGKDTSETDDGDVVVDETITVTVSDKVGRTGSFKLERAANPKQYEDSPVATVRVAGNDIPSWIARDKAAKYAVIGRLNLSTQPLVNVLDWDIPAYRGA